MFYMKRILVLSDSHGNVNNMVTAVGRLHPDMIIHLGDTKITGLCKLYLIFSWKIWKIPV